MTRLIVVALVLAWAGGVWAQGPMPPCNEDTTHCRFLAEAYQIVGLWDDVKRKHDLPNGADALAQDVIDGFALWLELSRERIAVVGSMASDEHQDTTRRALAGDAVATARLKVRSERVLARAEELEAERGLATDVLTAAAERFFKMVADVTGATIE